MGFRTIPTVWHYSCIYWTLELIRECGIICFTIGLSNSSDNVALLFFHFSIEPWSCCDSVALLVFLWVFGTVLTVCHYLVFYWTLELFRQCGIIGFPLFYWILELLRHCGIIGFSMRLWNCSDSVPLFGFLLDFGTVPTVWHYWFFIFLLGFGAVATVWVIGFSVGLWNCFDSVPLFSFLLDFGTVPTVWHYCFFY
jgi:hypothetical protein